MRVRAPRAALPLAVIALALPAATLAGCTSSLPPLISEAAPIQGQGDVTTEPRSVGDFERLSVAGGIVVVVTTGSPASVTLAAQANLHSLVETDVRDGQLVVTVQSPGFSTPNPPTLTIVASGLRSISLSAGAKATVEVTGTNLAVDVSGGASLVATGRAQTLAVTASSGGKVDFGGLAADTATVTLSGGADAQLNVTGSLTGTASAGSTVRLTQRPATLQVTTSSGATVQGG